MKKPDLDIPTYNASQFFWERSERAAADASDLGCTAGITPGRQVWHDACDVGFLVKFARTNETRLFTLTSERRNAENELEAWIFVSEDGFTATIYND